MDKYISAEAVREYLKRVIFGADQKIDRWVDQMPAADVRPVVRGKWHDVYQGADGIVTQTCSVCKKYHQTSIKCSMPQLCPNCGADMRPAAGGQCSPLQGKTEDGRCGQRPLRGVDPSSVGCADTFPPRGRLTKEEDND